MSSIMLLLLILSSVALQFIAVQSIGVCYGTNGNLPSSQEVIDLYKSNGIKKMRIYSPDEAALQALRGSNIELLLDVGSTKEDLQDLTDPAKATDWVKKYVASYSDVNIKYIAVGNEIPPEDTERAPNVLPAMKNIQNAISAANLQGIKVSTAIKMDLLDKSSPPRDGSFKAGAISYIQPILDFLDSNGSPLLANVYPYFAYTGDPNRGIPLEYALFTQQGTNDGYQNLFDAMVDAIYAALEKRGKPNMQIVVSESGWPSDGGDGATETVNNARTYYQNLVDHVDRGTPMRSGPIETYLFAMFDENKKEGKPTEQHFGLFNPDKSPKYGIRFN